MIDKVKPHDLVPGTRFLKNNITVEIHRTENNDVYYWRWSSTQPFIPITERYFKMPTMDFLSEIEGIEPQMSSSLRWMYGDCDILE